MKREQLLYISSTALGFFFLAILYFMEPGKLGYDVCFSRHFLHFYCAGCGATRATRALLHGEIVAAFRLNIIYVLSIPFLIYLWIGVGQRAFHVKSPLPLPGLRTLAILLCILILFSLIRNLPFENFSFLRPE